MSRINAVPSSSALVTNHIRSSVRAAAEAMGIELDRLPRHIAFIMDGNRRWATRRGRQRTLGHRAGVETAREMVRICRGLDIPVMTLYAFSTENWNRSVEEVEFLLRLLENVTKRECHKLKANGVRMRFMGEIDELPVKLQEMFRWAERETEENSALILNLAVNYGGRREIAATARRIGSAVRKGELEPEAIDEDTFARYLYTAGLPDPDLLIRTSGEVRVSNYLLWQIAYTEIWVTETCWPDLRQPELLQAIFEYQQRRRNFGG